MRGQRQNVRSTKVKAKTLEVTKEDEEEQIMGQKEREHDIMIKVYEPRKAIHTDQMGKFPHISSRGNKYMMVLTEMDSNSIWVETMKNRTEGEMMLAWQQALVRMKACGIVPKHQVLDNEAAAAYKQEIEESGMTYELVPPDNHRRNIAEKAIQTWKDHFVAIPSGASATFPMHLWCRIIPQVERQLQLLIVTNINPTISTYTHLHGPHNYNAQPWVPVGMEAMIRDKSNKRKPLLNIAAKGMS